VSGRRPRFDPAAAGEAVLIVADVDPRDAAEIQEYGRRHRILVNIVDKPAFCSFIFPAVMERGNLLVAVSTQGRSPALAGWLKEKLFDSVGREYSRALEVLGQTRREVQAILPGYQDRRDFYRDLFSRGWVDRFIDSSDLPAAEELLQEARAFAQCKLSAAEPAASTS
jgi:siroheme synthase-like protein